MIITRGFGEQDGVVIEYVPVPICEPEMTAQEWGRKNTGKQHHEILTYQNELEKAKSINYGGSLYLRGIVTPV